MPNSLLPIASFLSAVWDWIDKRDIDKHVFAWIVAYCGWDLTMWARVFVGNHPITADMALVVGAVAAPYALFAGAITKWYFERQDT